MFQNSIIPNELSLYKFFKHLKFDLYLTKPQLKHLENFTTAMILKGFKGKVADVAELSSVKHRTSITRFLSNSNWNENLLVTSLKSTVINLIWKKSRESKKPIYLIIDDTISEKTKPSSKALNPIEKCYFHNSHLKRKTVYGHQLVVALLSCDGLILPYLIKIYDKNNMSKIDIATKIIKSLPTPISKGFILCDSWYSCKAIFNASALAGYAYIGALKTNRVIYPKGHRKLGIKLHKFAASLNKDSFDLVTVKGKHYYIYNYIGCLNDMKNVSITLSYPKESFQKEGSLKAFISLDLSLKPLEILYKYTDRWAIEPFFRDCKQYLGLDSYQIRSKKAIFRYLIIMFITYTYCKLYSNKKLQFNEGLKLAKNDFKKHQVVLIYSAALNGQPIERIFKILKIA